MYGNQNNIFGTRGNHGWAFYKIKKCLLAILSIVFFGISSFVASFGISSLVALGILSPEMDGNA